MSVSSHEPPDYTLGKVHLLQIAETWTMHSLSRMTLMQNATEIPAGSSICVSRAYGKIMGQNVTVVSSGINAQSSALCTLELLSCASHIKDFIYTGTSGFSAAVVHCSITHNGRCPFESDIFDYAFLPFCAKRRPAVELFCQI